MNIEITKQELAKTFNKLRTVVLYAPTFERVTYSLCAAYSRALAASLDIDTSLVGWTIGTGREVIFKRYDTSDSGEVVEIL